MADGKLPIGALGKATDTQTETIRYYEHIGLLPAPERTRAITAPMALNTSAV
jgi:hypothetical protein